MFSPKIVMHPTSHTKKIQNLSEVAETMPLSSRTTTSKYTLKKMPANSKQPKPTTKPSSKTRKKTASLGSINLMAPSDNKSSINYRKDSNSRKGVAISHSNSNKHFKNGSVIMPSEKYGKEELQYRLDYNKNVTETQNNTLQTDFLRDYPYNYEEIICPQPKVATVKHSNEITVSGALKLPNSLCVAKPKCHVKGVCEDDLNELKGRIVNAFEFLRSQLYRTQHH